MDETLLENTKELSKVSTDERRLWIGNLDPRINEYHLLKLLQKHGEIEKFDLLFHRSGPMAGQPRGYAFVTFVNTEDANTARIALQNTLVGCKKISVMWAHSVNTEVVDKPKQEIFIPALAMHKTEKKVDRQHQIEAIEAKLKLMEKKSSELEINKTVATEPPVITQYQFNRIQSPITGSIKPKNVTTRKCDRYNKPYSKHKPRR